MKTSEKGINLIKQFEGCRLSAYKCPAGVWTIGYGHTAGVSQKQTITQKQADIFLQNDLVKYERYVNETVKMQLQQAQFDALVSFTYNCGVGNLRTLIKNRNLNQIASAMVLYNKGGGKVLPGLTRRRKAEKEMFLSEGVQENEVKKYYVKCSSKQVGIVDALNSIGVYSYFKHRSKIAEKNNITGYKGTAEQNIKMLNMLKCGNLVKV